MDEAIDPANLYAEGCQPDVILLLRDSKGHGLCRLKAVKAILAAWSPVLRGAMELAPDSQGMIHSSYTSNTGCVTTAFNSSTAGLGCGTGSGFVSTSNTSSTTDYAGTGSLAPAQLGCQSPVPGVNNSSNAASTAVCNGSSYYISCGMLELPLQVDNHIEVEAWRVALCLMHPLDPTCGKSPSSLITTCVIKPLVMLADKYNLQGLLPYCKDTLLDPRNTFGVPGIHEAYKLDALEWIQIAESVPGFDAVVVRCITQIVASTTCARGRSQRLPGVDQPRYRGHELLCRAMAGLRPETCAKLACSMASCLAVTSENMANQDRFTIKPVGEHWWGWEYQYEPFRK